ncbi:hypothetical protein AHF37_04563 [Paragonimus kellicotti]|nr:hypothetical protein AHF37_04563 [Paragonimus kellicotti]
MSCFLLLSLDPVLTHRFIIYVNGKPIGFTEQPGKLAALIRGLRRAGRIDCFVSVHIKQVHRCVHVVSDGGRLCRPYIVVANNRPLVTQAMLEDLINNVLSWDDFLKKGVIEYLDANELNDCLVAMDEFCLTDGHRYTHMEIDPSTILGVVAGLIPYPDHNQSPRNTYQCAMGKQAIGTVALNQQIRFDTLQYQMVYPQKPLVQSKTIQMMHFDELPAGQNAIVAIMSYSGYDVEDALIVNRASLDRGFARACVYRRAGLPAGQNAIVAIMSYSGYDVEDALIVNRASLDRGFARACVYRRAGVHLKMHENAVYDRLMGPSIDRETGLPRRGDELLQADGTAYVGAKATDRQILVNKEMPVVKTTAVQDNAGQLGLHAGTSESMTEFRRCPADYKGIEPSYVEKVLFSTSEGNQAVVKVLLRQTRRPEVGDKFSSRHGQKGVVGLIVRQEDMPFSLQGLVPDIIMNPHGFPSRMTLPVFNYFQDRIRNPHYTVWVTETGLPRRGDELLQADGTAYVGAKATDRQILVNKEMPVVKTTAVQDNAGQLGLHAGTSESMTEFRRCPADYKGIEPSYVEKVLFSTSEGNQAVVKVLLRQTRRPEVGDKFSSRHGQKGVVGLIVRQEDMPFSLQGLVPDIIMNPHGFPSRMTVGKLLELLGSKAGAIEGRIRDGSAFSGDSAETLSRILIDHGHHYLGKEILHSGVTGAPLEAYIYFGPVYYQRLKHMVMDKVSLVIK